MAVMALTGEHPQDVLERLGQWQDARLACALVVITHTEGGAVRAPGALLAVSETKSLGYISGGCIDADVILQARASLSDRTPRALRYGAGSPFVDLPLPCGGAIEVMILPNPESTQIRTAYETLQARKPLHILVTPEGRFACDAPDATTEGLRFSYAPKLRIRIAGRGCDALAVAKLSRAAGFETLLQTVDEEDAEDARKAGITSIECLRVPSDLSDPRDDAWTAFVLLFHDQDWETPLLRQALQGPAFYLGAVGSQRTHDKRCDALRADGVGEAEIDRIHGPIGLVPSLRDASMLSISILAEIVNAFKHMGAPSPHRTAFILLAAGASSRFEAGDKLLAQFEQQTVLERSAGLLCDHSDCLAIAVCAPEQTDRRAILENMGWDVLTNPKAREGQSTSLKTALRRIASAPTISQIVILLADMPNIPPEQIDRILSMAHDPEITAIMSADKDVLCPPALFKRPQFAALEQITGDRGAKTVFESLTQRTEILPLSAHAAIDIDRVADLKRALDPQHA